MSDSTTEHPAPRRARVRAPELIGKGGWLNTGGKQLHPRRPAREDCGAGFLDVLLHQLPACPGRAAGAGGEAPRHGGDHRGALAEVRARGRARGRRRRRRAVRGAPPRARRSRARHLEAVRRTGLADARRDRPRGVRRRPARRRGACARHRAAGRGAGGRARGQGDAAARGRAVRGAGARSRPTCGSPARPLLLPDGNFLVSRHHPAPARRAGGGRGERRTARRQRERGFDARDSFSEPQGLALLPDGPGGRRRHREPRAARARPGHRRGRRPLAGTGRQWWQGSPTSGPALGGGPVLAVGRGLVAAARCGSPWPVSTSCGRTTRRTAPSQVAAGTTNEGLVRRAGRRGLVRAALRARGDRGPALDRRLRDRPPLRWVDPDGCGRTPPSGPGCSTSGTGTAPPDQALLQHPFGVTALPDGSVAVSDTYNHALRRYDPATGRGHHAGHGSARAERRRAGRGRHRGRRVRPAPADPAAAAGGGGAGRGRRPPHPARGHRSRARQRSGWTWSSRPRRARSSTPGTARRPGCSSPRPRPSCCCGARARAPTCPGSWS